MVCSLGSVKMAVMGRFLASESYSQSVTEIAGHQKLVAQYIQKELLEADEATLLDEEDLYIFDLNPLTDPLHLVSCNSCKKPVKASQFVIHAELCRTLGFAEELRSELESGTGNRKPPRKERKKLATLGNQVMCSGVQERFGMVDFSETAGSNSQLDERVGITSSSLVQAKEIPGKIAVSSGDMIPLTKRPKLVAADTVQLSDVIQTAQGVSYIISCLDANACKARFRDVQAPLATKTYYSQRNNRLQAALSYMYQASIKECCGDKRGSQGNLITRQASPPRIFPEEQFDDHSEKKRMCSSPNKPDENFMQSSEVTLANVGCQSSVDSLNQFPVSDAYTSQEAAFGTTTIYHPRPHSSRGNSGTPLATVQQPNGSVPVV